MGESQHPIASPKGDSVGAGLSPEFWYLRSTELLATLQHLQAQADAWGPAFARAYLLDIRDQVLKFQERARKK